MILRSAVLHIWWQRRDTSLAKYNETLLWMSATRSGRKYKESQLRMANIAEHTQPNEGEAVGALAEMLRMLVQREEQAEERRRREEERRRTEEDDRRRAEEERRQREDDRRRAEEQERRQREEERRRAEEQERRQREEERRRAEDQERLQREEERRQREVAERERMEAVFAEERREQRRILETILEAQAPNQHRKDTAKLTKLTESEDIEAYLTTFERMMVAHEVEEEKWAFKLAPNLSGKAQLAYAAMDSEGAKDYEQVKETILLRYNINTETYRQRFRSAKKQEDWSYRDLIVKLQDLSRKWTKDKTSAEEVVDLMVTEQFLTTLPQELRVWVTDRKPKTSTEAGQMADEYVQTRKSTQENKRVSGEKVIKEAVLCHTCGKAGHIARDCRSKSGGVQKRNEKEDQEKNGRSEIRCFSCGGRGHMSMKCPSKALTCLESSAHPGWHNSKDGPTCSGKVEGKSTDDILLDTGCSRTMVHTDFVMPGSVSKTQQVTIRCAHGEAVSYPIAAVNMEIDGVRIRVKAAVCKTLPVSVLLGTDVPELFTLLSRGRPKEDSGMAVVTRSKHKQQQLEGAEEQVKDLRSGARPTPLDEPTAEETYTVPETESHEESSSPGTVFHQDLFTGGRSRTVLTRRQKRERKREHGHSRAKEWQGWEFFPEEVQRLQREDETLKEVREATAETALGQEPEFFQRDGTLYRNRKLRDETVEQLVLPKACRDPVLQMAHAIPMAGHLGRKKTTERVLQRFFWPGVSKDVAEYCKNCPSCQKASSKRVAPAPLIPLPVIGEPFSRIALDIVGPLPRSRSGNRFVLVICDYATRYPEAIPLRSVDAEHVAEQLVQVFSRVGIPQEIMSDQGSNFMSALLAEMYGLLKIQRLRTTPYHPQCNGLVERFNQTLKSMLRRSATKDGKDWDKLLPYLLFAYREVPQESTGFSPFELLYGRRVRGPLDVLKETWEAKEKTDESVLSHLMLMRERLEKMSQLSQTNTRKAQQGQKTWYDKHARLRRFEPGEKVLVLLPTDTSKFLAQWKGPYPVVKRVSDVLYEIDMIGTRKRHRVFHINMLKRWNEVKSLLCFEEDDVEEEILDTGVSNGGKLVINEHLDEAQYQELELLCSDFQDVLHGTPGCTMLTEHSIPSGLSTPVRQVPYRLPYARREWVKKEIEAMFQDGVIESSISDWASPIVLIEKKDGGIRFCVDYRKLNSVTQGDAYPMPRVDELLDQLGNSQYLTTLDLARGYWQVPVKLEDRHKTAFTTPYGLYQFKVMPFGLCGAPATFQRMMDRLLRGAEGYAAAYIDDLVIYSPSWEEHCGHVKAILTRLRDAKLTARPEKCQMGMRHCTYLGHVVGCGQVKPEQSKLEAVKRFPIPLTKKDVRSFLGLTGYYRRFIANYASLVAPLTDLTRNTAPTQVEWTSNCEKVFQELKMQLCSVPVIRTPDFKVPFILQTDASDCGIGGVLSQLDASGEEHPVAYFSRKLVPREKNYATIEKECLSIKAAIQNFRVYLFGAKFTVVTDHRALKWLNTMKDNNPRLTRWYLFLQPYQFEVEHRSGKLNGNADALSRGSLPFGPLKGQPPDKVEGV